MFVRERIPLSIYKGMYTVFVFVTIHPHSIDLGISNIVARKFFVFCLDSQQWYQSRLCVDVSVRVERIARCER